MFSLRYANISPTIGISVILDSSMKYDMNVGRSLDNVITLKQHSMKNISSWEAVRFVNTLDLSSFEILLN